MDEHLSAAISLHRYLAGEHWRESALIGPDPGIRFAYRVGRFLKSYAPGLSWGDDYYYLQAQGYWALGNWRMYAATDDDAYRHLAMECSRQMLARQRPDGAWDYPHVEWRGRIATVEGIWGSLGLLESYRQTADSLFLAGARRWHDFLQLRIGYQRVGDGQAVNYFAGRSGDAVPNNSACALRFLAELSAITGDAAYLDSCADLVRFLTLVQQPNGELPYTVEPITGTPTRPHFQCYQYNAFQFLDLLRYYELTDDLAVRPVLIGLLDFLRTGIGEDGHAFYSCQNHHGAVTYHATVLAIALLSAGSLGEPRDFERGRQAFSYVLGLQAPDGSFPHSRGDYRLLRDDRRYPRYLAMILYHLMLSESGRAAAPAGAACGVG